MTDSGPDRDRLERLERRIEQERDDLAEMEGTDEEIRFSDDGTIDDGAGTDANAPPG